MAEELQERVYNVPLRKEFLKVSRYRRTKRAVAALQKFLVRHMKCSTVKIGKTLNEDLWKHGIQNPPHHVKIHTVKKEGVAYAELFGTPIEFEKKKEEKKGLAEKLGLGDQTKEEGKLEQKVEGKTDKKAERVKEATIEKKEHSQNLPKATAKPVEEKTAVHKVPKAKENKHSAEAIHPPKKE